MKTLRHVLVGAALGWTACWWVGKSEAQIIYDEQVDDDVKSVSKQIPRIARYLVRRAPPPLRTRITVREPTEEQLIELGLAQSQGPKLSEREK